MSDVYFEVFDIMCMHSNRFGMMIGPPRARVTISLSLMLALSFFFRVVTLG